MAPSLDLPLMEHSAQRRTKTCAPLDVALARPQQRDVHVWALCLDQPPLDALAWLDATERARAQRFVHVRHRTRFIAAHAWLRHILGRYLECPPQDLQFVLGPYGKPELRESRCTPQPAGSVSGSSKPGASPGAVPRRHTAALRFNLSHSDNMALLAVSNGVAIGVDIEALRPELPDATLAAGVLTAAERAELAQLPAGQRTPVFFACWTRKEACMKALGLGLALEPRSLHVGMAAQRQQLHLEQADVPLDLCPLPAPGGYAAALAAVGGFGQVTMRQVGELRGRLN